MATYEADHLDAAGPEKTALLFPLDHTHSSVDGAELNAQIFIQALRANTIPAVAASTSTALTGNNIRSGTTDGNGNFWAVGAGGTGSGTLYYNSSTTAITNSATSANNRIIQDIGGNLYFSTGSGSTRGIYMISGTPTTTGNTATSFINTSSRSSAPTILHSTPA